MRTMSLHYALLCGEIWFSFYTTLRKKGDVKCMTLWSLAAGVIGCSIARELSGYALRVCVVEKEADVGCGTSKANSAIIHAGYDAAPGSLKGQTEC